MNKTKLTYITAGILLLIMIAAVVYGTIGKAPGKTQETASATEDKLRIVSTNPTSLDGITISPSQPIEITFSKPLSISGFKYKIDPQLEHEVTATEGDSSFGKTFRITFKKPLELGAAFTLTINSDTKVSDKEKLDKEYIYHIQTIGYSGV